MSTSIAIEIAKHTRINFIRLMDSLTIDQLNIIPAGFNNNIAWNFAHIVVAQQTVCYLRSNVTPRLPMGQITKYRKGTRPEGFISMDELRFFKEQAFSLLDALDTDIAENVFANYEISKMEFGVTLQNINDAVPYFMSHDNLHLGYALALRRLVINE